MQPVYELQEQFLPQYKANICCRIFGHEGQDAEDVMYVNWLSLLWNGAAKATEMYQPSTENWLQVYYLYI